jgi:LemA protein
MPMDGFVILWVMVGLVVFWSVGAHNRLVRLRSQAIAAFVAVDHHFMQYVQLIRTNAYFTNDSGLAELITTPVDSLSQAWVGLDGAATQFEVSLKMVRAHPLDAAAVEALQTAYSTLRSSWDRVQNEPPDLAGHRLPDVLQQEWAHVSLLISPVSAHFNHLVVAYNAALTQFPANMLAYLLMLKPGRIL